MSAGAVKRPIFVEHHLLNQVFATAEKDVANAAVILNDAAQPSLNVIAPVLQQLLKLVQDDYDAGLVLRRDFGGCFQNFLQHRFNPGVFRQPNESVGFPSSSTVRLGERLPKNLLAVSISFSVEELIDSVIALATAATNVVSLSVGHKST